MSNAKFTPGPWSIRSTGPHWNNPDLCNIEINHGDDQECVCDTVYEMGDACLIVAAPDMYDLLDTFPGFTSTTAEKAAWAQRVIDVKHKARGEL